MILGKRRRSDRKSNARETEPTARRATGPEPARALGSRIAAAASRWKVLGLTLSEQPRLVGVPVSDARYHLHMPGTTGAGKSTLLANLVLQDAIAGRGAVVVDPKGDLVVDLLDRLPASVAGRLVVIDPDEDQAPPALNVLDGPDPWRTTDDLVAILRRVFAAYWGPRTDDILRCACLTLARQDSSTLADVPRLLTDPAYRQPLVVSVRDDAALQSFWDWYHALGDATQATVVGPLLSKLRAILARPFVANLFGNTGSTFSVSDVLDGGLLLARLPKGILGEDTARLVGSILVAKVWHAALARASRPEAERRDAGLYVDECHNFLNLASPIDDMLAEARGYRLSITLAHQHFGQLGRDLEHAISANALNKIVFRVEPDDASRIARHLSPIVVAADIVGLDSYHAGCRLLANARAESAFTIRTLPPAAVVEGRADQLRQAARERYGLDAEQRRSGQLKRQAPARASASAPAVAPASTSASGFRNEHTFTNKSPGQNGHSSGRSDPDSLEE